MNKEPTTKNPDSRGPVSGARGGSEVEFLQSAIGEKLFAHPTADENARDEEREGNQHLRPEL